MITLPIAAFAPSWWTAIAALIANHLWQSTLFAGVAGLLTVALRKNRAQTRYALWLAASVKLLVPFSLLVGVGSHLGLSKAPAVNHLGLFVVVQQIGQPFAPGNAAPAAASAMSKPLEMAVRILQRCSWSCGSAAARRYCSRGCRVGGE